MPKKIFCIVLSILIGSIFLFFTNTAKSVNTDIVINEVCPTGCAASGRQWIEIYNKGSEAVDLTGWKFWENNTNHGLIISPSSTIQNYVLGAGEYALIVQDDQTFFQDYSSFSARVFDSSWGTLNNSGEEIGLKFGTGGGDFVEKFIYLAINNFSLERKDANLSNYSSANWQEHPSSNTAGAQNYWTQNLGKNQPPTASITATSSALVNETVNFSGQNSTDSDGTIVSFDWSFGDGNTASGVDVSHAYNSTGIFTIALTVTDDQGANEAASSTIIISSNSTSTYSVLINEFVSDPVSDEKEWIELYNFSTSSIDLTGWTLSDGVGVKASPTSTISSGGFFIIELSDKLNNSGDIIILKNTDGQIIDQVSYGSWDDGNKDDNTKAADDPNSVARIVDGQDTDNDKNDFAETTTPTKGLANIITAPASVPTSSGGGGGGSYSPAATYNPGDIVINELVSDPADGEDEFVELYNRAGQTINLSGWWLEDGSETKTDLNGIISPGGFYLIEKPKGNLNNSGDMVILFSPDGKEIDSVTYGSWDDGDLSDNAPAASDPFSLARKADGLDSDYDYYDFALTATITAGKANKITVLGKDGQTAGQTIISSQIIINEIFPNPKGSDNENEFIELKNIGAETINLKDWQLSDSTAGKYKITQGIIPPGSYFVFKRAMTGIALNNTGGDEVKLYLPNGGLVDSIKYAGSAKEEESYARRADNGWAWTTKTTPGAENIIAGVSAAPVISLAVASEAAVGEKIIFDASDTTDPEGENMVFNWDFGNGQKAEGEAVEHIFTQKGNFTVELAVKDSAGNEAKKKVIIQVKGPGEFSGGYYDLELIGGIKISEIFPNPAGVDNDEFIELFNSSVHEINLSGLKIDDDEGGSRAFAIPEGVIIQPGAYMAFWKKETKLALNNTSDAVRLLSADNKLIGEVLYDGAVEDASYIQGEDSEWVWTSAVTPGTQNIYVRDYSSVSPKTSLNAKKIKTAIEVTLDKIREQDIGDLVKVQGVVAVEPGVVGSQYFYIVDQADSTGSLQGGVQVYMNKKDFPILRVGDKLEVSGEISEAYGERRIKIKEKIDIKMLGFVGAPQPQAMEIAAIDESLEGGLVQIEGEITDLKSTYMYVDDGSEEIKVYFKKGAGIDKKNFQLGDFVAVSGIVGKNKDGVQLLPRSSADINKLENSKELIISAQEQPADDSKNVAEIYLTATAGGLTSILIGLLIRARGALTLSILKKAGKLAMIVFRRPPRV